MFLKERDLFYIGAYMQQDVNINITWEKAL